jgi:energy-coupling factor transporter transmembrane protein EcfT
MDTFTDLVRALAAVFLFVTFVAVLTGLPLMWLWNWLMPELFGLKTITFWQAVGLNFLSSILFKSSSSSSSRK